MDLNESNLNLFDSDVGLNESDLNLNDINVDLAQPDLGINHSEILMAGVAVMIFDPNLKLK